MCLQWWAVRADLSVNVTLTAAESHKDFVSFLHPLDVVGVFFFFFFFWERASLCIYLLHYSSKAVKSATITECSSWLLSEREKIPHMNVNASFSGNIMDASFVFQPLCYISVHYPEHKSWSCQTNNQKQRACWQASDSEMNLTFSLLSSSCFCSAVSGNDHEAEADWPAGAVPLFPWRRGSDLSVGLLPLQPAAGPQGDLQLRENSGGALPRCQPDWGTTQGTSEPQVEPLPAQSLVSADFNPQDQSLIHPYQLLD